MLLLTKEVMDNGNGPTVLRTGQVVELSSSHADDALQRTLAVVVGATQADGILRLWFLSEQGKLTIKGLLLVLWPINCLLTARTVLVLRMTACNGAAAIHFS